MRFLVFLMMMLSAAPLAAQDRRPSHCIAIAGLPVTPVAWTDPVADDTVRISYIDHSTFLIQTPGGLAAATDYTGFLGLVELTPDVVTMNNAHESHFTTIPDPDIPHVLQGWPRNGIAALHHLDLGEMLVRNVTTDIRSRFGPGTEIDGNSIFIFEVGGLCIGHLGHLHHAPTEAQYALIGRLDVVMAPVDGRLTMSVDEMITVMDRFRARVVLPMHWFGPSNLEAFLARMEERFVIEYQDSTEITVSLRTLPDRPTVFVLRNAWLRDP